jgi:hypothetical protein
MLHILNVLQAERANDSYLCIICFFFFFACLMFTLLICHFLDGFHGLDVKDANKQGKNKQTFIADDIMGHSRRS